MYFATVDADSGRLVHLTLVPLRMRRFRLEAAAPEEQGWLLAMLNREGKKLGARFELAPKGMELDREANCGVGVRGGPCGSRFPMALEYCARWNRRLWKTHWAVHLQQRLGLEGDAGDRALRT